MPRDEALEVLIGEGEGQTEFGRVYRTLEQAGRYDVLDQIESAIPDGEALKGLAHHQVRAKIRDDVGIYDVLLDIVGAGKGTSLDADAARESHRALMAMIRGEQDGASGLGSEYKGELVERWYERVLRADQERGVDYHLQRVVPADEVASGKKRILDELETPPMVRQGDQGTEIVEIKGGEREISTREGSQFQDLLQMTREETRVILDDGTEMTTGSLRYVFVDPDGAAANAEMMWDRMMDERKLTMEFFTKDGTRRVLASDEIELLKRRGWNSETLEAYIRGGDEEWPLN